MTTAAKSPVEPRAYQMVRFIERNLPNSKLEKARVMNLPGLLQRCGLLQVSVFLESKGRPEKKGNPPKSDEVLRRLLEDSLRTVVGEFPNGQKQRFELNAKYLAHLELARILLLEELAVEAAVWIRRLYEATAEPNPASAPTAGEPS